MAIAGLGPLWKFAVTVAGAFSVRFCGFVTPVSAPLKPVKTYAELADALTWTTVPAFM
jgi:hypothetical protein